MSSSLPTIDFMCELVALVCGKARDEIHADTRLVEDLCMDSLAMGELLLGIEENYGVVIDAAALAKTCTVADMQVLAIMPDGSGKP